MAGSGTKEDPWLIETATQMATVLRSQTARGYYRMTGNFGISLNDGGLSSSIAQNYLCKVIDQQGYRLSVSASNVTTGNAVIAGVMFVNGFLAVSMSFLVQYAQSRPFVNCFFTDCLVNLSSSGAFSHYFGYNIAWFSALEAKEFRRLLVLNGYGAASTLFDQTEDMAGTSFIDVYKWTSATGSWYTRITAVPTLAALDALTSGRFTAAGWFNDTSLGINPIARPFFADVINFVINTLVDGVPTERQLMYEADGQWFVLGGSDAGGLLDLTLRVRRFLTLRIVATESYALDRMQNGNYVAAGKYYLPPTDNGRKYQASSAGQLSNLQSVTFGAAPVVVNGITLTPAAVHPEMASGRTTLQTGGPQQFITLDTADMGGGGGGPVIEGDPAYLDGVVEEIHPMTGTLRPLVNAEVAVFERRANVYVPMGAAVSNQVGEFRVETEVYGGGDVLAFALDFPGLVWQPAIELGIGSRIRPTINNGYVYEIITAGNSGASEPTWWADEGDGTEGTIGSATAKARPYYQPVGHGPLKMTLVE